VLETLTVARTDNVINSTKLCVVVNCIFLLLFHANILQEYSSLNTQILYLSVWKALNRVMYSTAIHVCKKRLQKVFWTSQHNYGRMESLSD